MRNWDAFPEFEEGDFFSFKDLHLGTTDENGVFVPSTALETLVKAYQFLDGLCGHRRLSSGHGQAYGAGSDGYFDKSIKEFARTLGKNNFYLIGEIAGGRENAYKTLEATGLDAALGIDEIPSLFRDIVTGRGNPAEYFRLFRNGPRADDDSKEDLIWWCDKVVTFFDDHDQVGRAVKARFASEFGRDRKRAEKAVLAVLGMNLMTIGVPCIYYGTEQGFNGHALGEEGGDRYIREAMLGGASAPSAAGTVTSSTKTAQSTKNSPRCLRSAPNTLPCGVGCQYLREISENGDDYALPQADETGEWRSLVAWSRLHGGEEIVLALNTDSDKERSAWVTVAPECHAPDSRPLKCLYSTDPAQTGTETSGPPEARNGSVVCLIVPPGGFVIYA
jgi:hypothetical protein